MIHLNNRQLLKTEFGDVQIGNEVIATIAGETAKEVDGVLDIVGTFMDDIAKTLKQERKGIDIRVENEELIIELQLVLAYGMPIPDVATRVQKQVKQAVETLTGLKVGSVNIIVRTVKLIKDEPSE